MLLLLCVIVCMFCVCMCVVMCVCICINATPKTSHREYGYTPIIVLALYLRTCYSYMPFAPGDNLRHFSITVGPYNGTYKKCGSNSNAMSKEDTKSFRCEPDAIGTSLKITLPGTFKVLQLCEVQILGKGIDIHWTLLHV